MKHKELLESYLDKKLSDSTWYRLNRKLKDLGIHKEEYPEVLKVVAAMNKTDRKQSKYSRVVFISRHFLKVWDAVRSFEATHRSHQLSCENFRKLLIEQMKYLPKNRFTKDGKYVGISTMWYHWFKTGGVNYKANVKHPIRDYIGVACIVLNWHENQAQHRQKEQIHLLGESKNV